MGLGLDMHIQIGGEVSRVPALHKMCLKLANRWIDKVKRQFFMSPTNTHAHANTVKNTGMLVPVQFNQLYEQAIDHSDKANMPSKRIHNIIEYLTYEIYLYIQRGLFERHKIIFALMLTNKILSSAGKIKVGGALERSACVSSAEFWLCIQCWWSVCVPSAGGLPVHPVLLTCSHTSAGKGSKLANSPNRKNDWKKRQARLNLNGDKHPQDTECVTH